jgi:hypothetical protein
MADPRNEPNAPPSKKQRGQIRSGWFLLIVLAIIIIAAIAMIADRKGLETIEVNGATWSRRRAGKPARLLCRC